MPHAIKKTPANQIQILEADMVSPEKNCLTQTVKATLRKLSVIHYVTHRLFLRMALTLRPLDMQIWECRGDWEEFSRVFLGQNSASRRNFTFGDATSYVVVAVQLPFRQIRCRLLETYNLPSPNFSPPFAAF